MEDRFRETGEKDMRYDFTKIIDRHGKDAIAVDGLGKNPGFAPEPPKDGAGGRAPDVGGRHEL